MTIFLIFVGITVLAIFLLNTRRWSRLARGAKDARHGLEDEIRTPGDG